MTDSVICCFCGQSLSFSSAVTVVVQPNQALEESQQLFCHRRCFVRAVDKAIMLHPDFFDDDESPQ